MMGIPLAREAELFAAVAGLPTEGVVVIGGYAVSARSIARYSHDIDLVLDLPAVEGVRSFLDGRKFTRTRSRPAIEQDYGGSWERWQRPNKGATIDLLPASVQDRTFKVPFPYAIVARGAELLALRGLQQGSVSMPVATNEILIALKMQPMRNRDIGDIACLAASGYQMARLRGPARSLSKARPELYRARLERLRNALMDDLPSAQRFLGSRIPGPPSGRARAIEAVRGLVGELERVVDRVESE